MFSSLSSLPAVPYADPWCLGLNERLRMLWAGKRRVAYFYVGIEPTTWLRLSMRVTMMFLRHIFICLTCIDFLI